MSTILKVIEKQLEKGYKGTAFTFLEDGENTKTPVSLLEIKTGALKVSRFLFKQLPVLILLPQGISFIKAFLGCLYAQALAVPVAIPGRNKGTEKLEAIIDDAKISIIITNRSTLMNLEKWFGEQLFSRNIKWILIEDTEQEETGFLPVHLPRPQQVALLQYTSGSTGNPKAVIITHENIIANSKIIQKCFANTTESTSVCWLPSFHDMGLIDGIVQPIFSGFHGILMSPMHFLQKPVRWLKAITDFRATYSGGPNFAFDYCNSRIGEDELAGINLSGLQCLYNGSETVRSGTLRNFSEKFSRVGFSKTKFVTCYGLAESTLAVTVSKLGHSPLIIKVDKNMLSQQKILEAKDKSFVELVGCGTTFCDTTLKIKNPKTLKICREKEVGEIWVEGKSIASGYYNRVESTNQNFPEKYKKRTLRTGDLGFIMNNELFVTGRIKDMIIIRGNNYYPQDIEQSTSISHEALMLNSCAAFSAAIELEEKLIIVQEIKRAVINKVNYEEIFSCIMAQISKIHEIAPYDIVLISPNTLPKTTSGKIKRNFCQKLWQAQQLNSIAYLNEYFTYKY